MTFEEFATGYNRPMPFCPWQGDMLYQKEIQFTLMEIEKICKEFCDPSTGDCLDDPQSYVKDVKERLGELFLFLGKINERTIFYGRLILERLSHPHPQQRYIEIREAVHIIFRYFAERELFSWDV